MGLVGWWIADCKIENAWEYSGFKVAVVVEMSLGLYLDIENQNVKISVYIFGKYIVGRCKVEYRKVG